MARGTDKTGKTGAGQLPAEIYKFPQSGSASQAAAEHGARPPNLSSAEQRLYDELLALARRLDKRGVSGVYGLVASVADQVTLLKHQGQSTVAALARGLDALKQIDASHTGKRLQTMREAMSGQEGTIICALYALLWAIGCLIAGFAVSAGFYPFGIFFLAVAAVFMVPALWDVMTKH